MKTILIILKHIISPFILFGFLILGLIAATLSGIVEYAVIKEIFTFSSDIIKYSTFIPLIIVVVLEGFKLFLHFVIPAEERVLTNKGTLVRKIVAKYFLVGFSLICTLIFSCNSMYKYQNVTTNTESQKLVIEENYKKAVDEIDNLIKEDKLTILKPYEDKITNISNDIVSQSEDLANLDPSNENYDSRYEKIQNEKIRLEDQLETAQEEYNSKILTIDQELQNVYSEKYTKADNERTTALEKLNKSEIVDTSGDNEYIRATLKFFTLLFKGNNSEYSRATYYVIVILISLIIAITLEVVISVSQSYISKKSEVLVDIFSSNEGGDDELKEKANRVLKIMIQAAIMFAMFLIYGAVTETMNSTSGNAKSLLITFGSYLISIILTSGNLGITIKGSGSNNKAVAKAHSIGSVIIPTLIQTLLCIMGFIVLCIVTGTTTASTIAPSTIALTVGSVSGQVIFSAVDSYKI